MELKQIAKWYVDNAGVGVAESCRRDQWCRDTFGGDRYRHELGDGWWLQSYEEYALFILTWK